MALTVVTHVEGGEAIHPNGLFFLPTADFTGSHAIFVIVATDDADDTITVDGFGAADGYAKDSTNGVTLKFFRLDTIPTDDWSGYSIAVNHNSNRCSAIAFGLHSDSALENIHFVPVGLQTPKGIAAGTPGAEENPVPCSDSSFDVPSPLNTFALAATMKYLDSDPNQTATIGSGFTKISQEDNSNLNHPLLAVAYKETSGQTVPSWTFG